MTQPFRITATTKLLLVTLPAGLSAMVLAHEWGDVGRLEGDYEMAYRVFRGLSERIEGHGDLSWPNPNQRVRALSSGSIHTTVLGALERDLHCLRDPARSVFGSGVQGSIVVMRVN